jgi:hypothetical protein
MSQLTELDLCGCSKLTLALATLSTCGAKLTKLNLNFTKGVSDVALQSLVVHRSTLRELHLAETDVTDVGLKRVLAMLGELETLDVYNCCQISDAGLDQLWITCPKLAHLDARATAVTDALVSTHLRFAQGLQTVDIRAAAGCRTHTSIVCRGR